MSVLLIGHAWLRWLVLIAIISTIILSFNGYLKGKRFDRKANLLRHWTATIAHIQLIVGMLVAFKSPYFVYFWTHTHAIKWHEQYAFFGFIHPFLMVVAIIILTIGSAKAKRQEDDRAKFKTIIIWFIMALLLICIAIPWPFSPFANRPLIPNIS